MPDLATLELRVTGAPAIATVKAFGDVSEVAGRQATGLEKAAMAQSAQFQRTQNITVASTRSMSAFSALNAEAAGHVGAHSLSVGRLERSLAGLTEHIVGLNPQVTLFAETLGHFAIGSIEMVAVLATMAALAYAWDKFTESSRKAREETDKALKSLTDLQTKQRQGSLGSLGDDRAKASVELFKVREEIDDLIRRAAAMRADPKQQAEANDLEAQAVAKMHEEQRLMGLLKASEIELAAIKKQHDDERAKALKEEQDRVNAIRYANEDRVRLAQQELDLVGKTGAEAARLRAQHEAINQEIDARRRLQGQELQDTETSIRQAETLKDKAADLLALIDLRKEAERQMRETATAIEREFSAMWDRVFGKGLGVFRHLGASLAKLLSSGLSEGLAGYIGSAAVGGTPATGAGGSILGGITAAISAHPFVAATVGIVALGSAILGMGDAAKAAHDAFVQFKKAFDESMDAFRLAAGTITDTQAQMNQVARDADALRVQAEHLNPHFGMVFPAADAAYKKTLEEINALEAKRLKLIQQQALEGLNATIGSLQAFKGSLALGGLSTLSPVQQLAEARRQYDDIVAKAKAGDQNAANQLPQFAQAFLNASRSVNASGAGYQQDFARVNADTDAIMAIFKAQATAQQVMIDILNAIRTGGQAAANQSHEDATDLIAGIGNLIGVTRQLQGAPV